MVARNRSPNRKKLALERIGILFQQAEMSFAAYPERSDRYVELARRISMRQRIRIPREFRRKFCQRCHAYIVPGVTARVRVHRGKVIVTCLKCGNQRRFPARRARDE